VPRCSATKRNGEPCRISVEPGVEFCWAHDPANREQRQRITSRAGKSKPNRELLSIKERLAKLADEVLDGSTDKAVGAVASQILNVYLRALEQERKWKELGEIEERISALEAQARSQGDPQNRDHVNSGCR
jgi:flagellar motility protein MotE (MotC chaperone)